MSWLDQRPLVLYRGRESGDDDHDHGYAATTSQDLIEVKACNAFCFTQGWLPRKISSAIVQYVCPFALCSLLLLTAVDISEGLPGAVSRRQPLSQGCVPSLICFAHSYFVSALSPLRRPSSTIVRSRW